MRKKPKLIKTNHPRVPWQVVIPARVTGTKRVRHSFASRDRALAYLIAVNQQGFFEVERDHDADGKVTLGDCVAIYLARRHEYSGFSDLKSVLTHLVARYGRKPITEIGRPEINTWLESLSNKAEATRDHYRCSVRRFLTWCHQEHQVISRNPLHVTANERQLKRGELAAVYLISDQETGLFKIGVSVDVNNRIAALINGSGRNLLLLKSWNCKIYASVIERALHQKFIEHRTRGEWFHLTKDAVQALSAIDNLDELMAFAGVSRHT
jgi:hypothetical protein